MRILVDMSSGSVDLQAPITMSSEQFEKVERFFKVELGKKIIKKQVTDVSRNWGERDANPKKWASRDYLVLIAPLSLKEKSDRLKRSAMSIWTKSSTFVPKFNKWAIGKGIKLPVSKKIIELFLQESGSQ